MENDISLAAHQYSIELETLFKKISPKNYPQQKDIRYNLYNNIENMCFKLLTEHQEEKERILAFLTNYSAVGDNIEELIITNGNNYVKKLITNFKHLLKGCGFNV